MGKYQFFYHPPSISSPPPTPHIPGFVIAARCDGPFKHIKIISKDQVS